GCIDSISDEVRINPDITVFVPTVFSPSSTLSDPECPGDCNRSFKVVADGFESIEIFVFNRWGQKVFETTDVNIGWNGSVLNKATEPCPQDAYIYQVNATSFSGKTYQYSGSITLLR
ncbi:MAG: gliding motility-associated C-terminal domain-containing protein, partial [Bacteroidetes bacterium]|nr:gliding motility-associated C-terminal domain-containing protein [Bacteroidota bacterium]